MIKEIPLALTFDDVLIKPKYSEITSRKQVDTTCDLTRNLQGSIPIISAPMDTVTGGELARGMAKHGGLGIIHRYMSVEDQMAEYSKSKGPTSLISINGADIFGGIAIGVLDDWEERLNKFVDLNGQVVLVDVAYGDAVHVLQTIEKIKANFSYLKVIAGNIATEEGFYSLVSAGADAIRVGIGGGSACSTRTMTGIGVPQLSAILDCAEASVRTGVSLIADGGIRTPGDFAKAIAAGADCVMLGGALAGTDESPGEKYSVKNDKGGIHFFKTFRGMASKDAREAKALKVDGRIIDGPIHAEGVSGKVPYIGPLQDRLEWFMGGLRSSMSYVGARTIAEFHERAEFVRVTTSGIIESNPHDLVQS